MNDRELTFYLLGLLGDSTKDEAIKSLKSLTQLSENEINEIISEIIRFNQNQFDKYHE
tara:strand:- start:92 stop:265 length:174 start_codon:yes stop_codon:yes gene_type:complete